MLTKQAIKPELLQRLYVLSKQPGWAAVSDILALELSHIRDLLTTTPSIDMLRMLQGRAQALKDFQELVATVDKHLERVGGRTPL